MLQKLRAENEWGKKVPVIVFWKIEDLIVKDSNGTVLKDGDDVALIKDLTLRGSSTTFKRGTKATNIKLTDNSDEVDCKLSGMAIVLRTEFLKKV